MATKNQTMLQQLDRARVVSVPLVLVRTADQAATVQAVAEAAAYADIPIVQWDAASGIRGVNREGESAMAGAQGRNPLTGRPEPQPIKSLETIGFVEAMVAAQRLPENTTMFVHNAHRQLHSSDPYMTAAGVQAVANLRDQLKKNFRMAILMGPYGMTLPQELEQDVVTIDDALPDGEQIAAIVTELYASSHLPAPKKDALDKAVEAAAGLSSFAVETAVSLSLTQSGVDHDRLWERKRQRIDATRGLSVYRGTERFADVRGLDNIKDRLLKIKTGKTPVGVAVFLDEIDKALANVESDMTGVRMDQLRVLLTTMEDRGWPGITFMGVPGGGKSLLAKAFGNECGVPTIMLDLADLEGSLVGESEQHLRRAMTVIEAIGQGHAFLIATSNNATPMRPEMQRRFTKGTFFFDLMTAEERDAAWKLHLSKLGLDLKSKRPNDEGWTGAEIRNCCEEAWNSGSTLVEASRYITPVSMSRAEEIDAMRRYAHGRYLDASAPGTYSYVERSKDKVLERSLRAINLPGKPN